MTNKQVKTNEKATKNENLLRLNRLVGLNLSENGSTARSFSKSDHFVDLVKKNAKNGV